MKLIRNRANWKILFLALTIIGYLPYISTYFDKITEIVLVLLFFLSIFDIYKNKNVIMKSKLALLLLIAPIFYLITIALNGFYFNDFKMFVYIVILLYFLCLDQSYAENPIVEYETISKILSVVSFFIVILSLIVFYQRITIPFSTDIFTEKYIGIYNNSMYGILGNANVLCFFSFIGLFTSAFLFSKHKLFYGLNIFLQIVCIFLTNSRGGYLGLLVSSSSFAFLYFVSYKKKKMIYGFLSVLVVVGILISGRTIIHSVNNSVFKILDELKTEETNNETVETKKIEKNKSEENIKNEIDTQSNPVNEQEKTENSTFEIERSTEEKHNNANRRLDMYKAGLKCFKDYPIFGVGREKTASILCEKYLDKNSPMNNIGLAYNMHNTYLQTLTGCGILGFIPMFGFIISMAVISIKYVLKKVSDDKETIFLISIISYSCYALFANLFESELYLSRSITALFFWLCLGYLYSYFIRKEHDEIEK